MEQTSSGTGITEIFLEGVLKQKIKSFNVLPGSNIGDNYTSIMYAIDVELERNHQPLHLLLKAYPSHPARQQFLEATKLFKKELLIYNSFIPQLTLFANEILGSNDDKEEMKLAFPPLIHGRARKYSRPGNNDLANYLLMVDIRKTWGYKMANRLDGLDFKHCQILMKELAKIHALSWAYKIKKQLKCLADKHACVKESVFCAGQAQLVEVMITQGYCTLGPLLKEVVGDESEIYKGFLKFQENAVENMLMYLKEDGDIVEEAAAALLRIRPVKEKIETGPWKVGSHGDCWLNNMLFQYDEEEVPKKLILVDLQLFREACPTIDLSYFFYTSTTHELRSTYLTQLLDIYSQHFLHYCKMLQVSPLPGFTLEELKRRFHRSKPYGLLCAVALLPLVLRPIDEAEDLETLPEDAAGENSNFGNILNAVLKDKPNSNTTLMSKRFVELAKELFQEGVI